jgi:hypothetical protein
MSKRIQITLPDRLYRVLKENAEARFMGDATLARSLLAQRLREIDNERMTYTPPDRGGNSQDALPRRTLADLSKS